MKIPSVKTIQPWRKYLTVEPVIFFYFYAWLMYYPVGQLYIYQRVSDMKGFPYKNISQGGGGGCGGEELSKNSSLWKLEKEVQTMAAFVHVGYNIIVTIPALLMAPFWGPWTDRSGNRKPALQAPILGGCIELTITLMVMYFEWPVYVLFLSAAVTGISGFAMVIMTGAMAYVADISGEEERGFRMAVLNLAVGISGFISFLTSGIWIEKLGFIPAAWFILSCHILAGIWSVFFVPDIRKTANDTKVRFFNSEGVKSVVNVFRKQREFGRKNLLLLMACMGLAFLSGLGIETTKVLFQLKSPLCWAPTLVGYHSAFEMAVHGIGAVVGVKLFGRFFKEMTVARIGMASFILAQLIFAFSDRTWMVFFAGLVGVFGTMPDAVLMGGMSRIMVQNEQGALFSAIGIVKGVTQLVGNALFNSIYQATLGVAIPCIVFLLCAGIVAIPFVLVRFIEMPEIEKEEIGDDHHLEEKNVEKQGNETPETVQLENEDLKV